MEIVLDGQTSDCAEDVNANFAQNVFLLPKTTYFSICSAIVLINQNNFFDFQA
jgi:hypothetical protein